jgi:hypothetical protein
MAVWTSRLMPDYNQPVLRHKCSNSINRLTVERLVLSGGKIINTCKSQIKQLRFKGAYSVFVPISWHIFYRRFKSTLIGFTVPVHLFAIHV